VLHATPDLHFAIVRFLQESCAITIDTLESIKHDSDTPTQIQLQKQQSILSEKLNWHTKSFVLRQLIAISSRDKKESRKSWRIMDQLLDDRKFSKQIENTVKGIQTSYSALVSGRERPNSAAVA
jgi:hypothetical protein